MIHVQELIGGCKRETFIFNGRAVFSNVFDLNHIANAMLDTNTVQETPTLVMYDSDSFFYVMQLTLVDLRIS